MMTDSPSFLAELQRRMNKLKQTKEAPIFFGLLKSLGYAPVDLQSTVVNVLAERITAVMSNLPGPPQALRVAGKEVDSMMFWVPQNGNIGLGISILSYNGKVFFGVIADRKLVPEPQRIIKRFLPEFENLLYLALMLPVAERNAGKLAQELLDL